MEPLPTRQAPLWQRATVKMLNPATGVEFTTVTTDAGVYRMPSLPPGTYRITVTSPGFKSAVRDNVGLSVAQTLTVDFTLEVGNVTDQVTVSANRRSSRRAPRRSAATCRRRSSIPGRSRSATAGGRSSSSSLRRCRAPRAAPGRARSMAASSIRTRFSSMASRSDAWIWRAAPTTSSAPRPRRISEFKLQTGTTSAQYTGGQTAVSNFATKSGTNNLHGSAYYYGQNDALRANSFNSNASGVPRQPFKQHNFGYSVAGPVYLPKIYNGRNRTFFYHNLERTKLKDYSQSGFATLPDPRFQEGRFLQPVQRRLHRQQLLGNRRGHGRRGPRRCAFGAIYDPADHTAGGQYLGARHLPDNMIPANRFSPVASKILELAPIEDPLFPGMLRNMPALASGSPEFQETMLTVKADHVISTNHRLSALFNRNFRSRYNSGSPRWGKPPGTPTGVFQNQNTPGTMGRLAWDFTARPNLLGRAALGYNRFGNMNESYYVDQDWPAKIGLQNVPGTHFPVLNFAGQPYQGGGIGAGGRLGSGNRGGSYNGSTIGQVDMTYVRGKHNIKFGSENRFYYYNVRSKSGSGDFNFSPNQTAQPGFINQTGHSFASFLLGAYASSSRAVIAQQFRLPLARLRLLCSGRLEGESQTDLEHRLAVGNHRRAVRSCRPHFA